MTRDAGLSATDFGSHLCHQGLAVLGSADTQFRALDIDRNGQVDRQEFGKAITELKLGWLLARDRWARHSCARRSQNTAAIF